MNVRKIDIKRTILNVEKINKKCIINKDNTIYWQPGLRISQNQAENDNRY